jgi:uncharacterized protein (DUF1697 family)
MSTQIVLLRGINLGPRRRVPMSELRDVLTAAGLRDVRTYVQSGNVVLSTDVTPEHLSIQCRGLIAERFGFDVPVIVRTAAELEAVLARDPLGALVTEPKRYQVVFLSDELPADALAGLAGQAADGERLAAHGRELYAWHPAGIARSKLWNTLAGPALGVTATARNWLTVQALVALAREG